VLEELITTYGYLAVLLGTFLEGEAVLIIGGLAVQLGFLQLPWVIAAAFAGTVAGDQLYYYLGRRHGRSVLLWCPAWRSRISKVRRFMARYHVWVVVGYRFVYGIRTITPFVIGLSRVPTARFVVLNMLSTLVWATGVGLTGYAFGLALEAVVGDIKSYQLQIVGFLVVVGAIVWVLSVPRRRAKAHDNTA
jgi:membrane protein DedA with SNARE-associated domain